MGDRPFDRELNGEGNRRHSGPPSNSKRGYTDHSYSGGQHKRKREDYAEPRNEEGRLLASLLHIGDPNSVRCIPLNSTLFARGMYLSI